MRKCSKPDGNKHWVGKRIAELRKDRGMSQNDLAIKLQNYGVDIDKNAVQLLDVALHLKSEKIAFEIRKNQSV